MSGGFGALFGLCLGLRVVERVGAMVHKLVSQGRGD